MKPEHLKGDSSKEVHVGGHPANPYMEHDIKTDWGKNSNVTDSRLADRKLPGKK